MAVGGSEERRWLVVVEFPERMERWRGGVPSEEMVEVGAKRERR